MGQGRLTLIEEIVLVSKRALRAYCLSSPLLGPGVRGQLVGQAPSYVCSSPWLVGEKDTGADGYIPES